MMRNGLDKARTNYLFNLIERGDNKKVEEFFRQYPDLINKIVSEHEWTPIMYACRYGNYELLMILENLGFPLDKHSSTSSTLMHLTFYSDNLRMIRHLVLSLDLANKEYTQMLKYSIFIKKKEITYFLFLNGGFVVNNHPPAQGPQASYSVHPLAVLPPTTAAGAPPAPQVPLFKYLSCEKDDEIPQDQILLMSDSREHVREIMVPLIQSRSKIILNLLVGLCCQKERFGTTSRPYAPIKNVVDVDLKVDEPELTPSYLDPVLQLLGSDKTALDAVMAYL